MGIGVGAVWGRAEQAGAVRNETRAVAGVDHLRLKLEEATQGERGRQVQARSDLRVHETGRRHRLARDEPQGAREALLGPEVPTLAKGLLARLQEFVES